MVELSDLIGFGYDQIDIQVGLGTGEVGFIFCGKRPLLMTRIQMIVQMKVLLKEFFENVDFEKKSADNIALQKILMCQARRTVLIQ